MLDAYTVRKAIPRIVLAVIAINLSIYLCVAAIDITNIIGHGLGDLITGPFLDNKAYGRVQLPQNGATITAGVFGVLTLLVAGATGVFALAGSTAAAGVIATAGLALLAVLVPFVISMMLITLAVMFTLIIRQALLIFLVVVSPVAIALFVLPGTEKYFKKWLDLFAKTLLVYPIIAVIFAMSTVMAQIILGTAELSAPVMGLVKVLATVIVVFAPLVMIPFAFKFAGGAISAVMNLANGKASGISGRAGQGFQAWRKNPNSAAGRAALNASSNRADSGLTSRQIWARRPGGQNRASRIQNARALDQKERKAALQDTFRAKATAQDSDVQDSLVMSEAKVASDRQRLNTELTNSRRLMDSGALSPSDLRVEQDKMLMNERKLDAHAAADSVGRTTATRQAAFNSVERIKFTSNTHDQELALAKDIFGERGAAEAMNEHQAIAKGPAGRTDLSASLYGQTYDLDRASTSQSMYMLMNQGRPDAVSNLIDSHVSRMYDPSASKEAKARSAEFLHSIKGAKGSGTPINNQQVNEKLSQINTAIDGHIGTVATEIIASGVAPKTEKRVVQREIEDPARPGEKIVRTETEDVPVDPSSWARRRAERDLQERSMAYIPPDPSERDRS